MYTTQSLMRTISSLTERLSRPRVNKDSPLYCTPHSHWWEPHKNAKAAKIIKNTDLVFLDKKAQKGHLNLRLATYFLRHRLIYLVFFFWKIRILKKQARKGFRPPTGYFQNLRNFLRNCLTFFWIFGGIFRKFFGKESTLL